MRLLCASPRRFFDFLIRPLHAATNHLIYTALTEVFFTQVKIAMFGGLCLGFPLIAAQLWIFVAPGLYRHEKRAFLPFLMWTPVLFVIGAGFVYYVMLPFAIKFFGSYQVPATAGAMGIELQAKVSDYLDFVMTLMFAFGLTFQLPVLLSLLGKVGIVTAKALRICAAMPCRPVRGGGDLHPAGRDFDDEPGGAAGGALRDLDLLRDDDRAGPGQGRRARAPRLPA